MWGAFWQKIGYEYDGARVDAMLFDAIAREKSSVYSFDDFRAGVAARVVEWQVYTQEKGLARLSSFAEFVRYISVWKIDYLYAYDGVESFSFLDWGVRGLGFPRLERDDQKDEESGARYKKVTGNGFTELTGELGQRYSFTIWSKQKRTRAEGGDRHERTHGTDFYAFKNFFNRGFEKTAAAFGVRVEDYESKAQALYEVITAFDGVCLELSGVAFLGDKKPLAMTAGGLAKRELLRAMYGSDNHGANIKAFRRAHPLTNAQDEYLRARKIMRGGICYANPSALKKQLSPLEDGRRLRKYDISSEYTAVAVDMPDLGKVEVCEVDELFNQKDGYTYIAIFEVLNARARKGMPAIFQNPFTGHNPRTLSIYGEIAIFWEEVEALKAFYSFGECSITYALRVKNGANLGYKSFGEKYYKIKEEARKKGNYGFAEFAKLMLNSAWGKLGQRNDFPEMSTEFDELTGLTRLDKRAPEPVEPAAQVNGLSVVQGAYVLMRGRVLLMDYIKRTCGEKNALDEFIYSDTDSIFTYAQAPADIVAPHTLGKLKEEGVYIDGKILAKKVYYCIESEAPLRAELHSRGITMSSIVERLLDEYGEDAADALPASALAPAFESGAIYSVPILAKVTGGRAVLYMNKSINEDKNTRRNGGRQVGDENRRLIEL